MNQLLYNTSMSEVFTFETSNHVIQLTGGENPVFVEQEADARNGNRRRSRKQETINRVTVGEQLFLVETEVDTDNDITELMFENTIKQSIQNNSTMNNYVINDVTASHLQNNTSIIILGGTLYTNNKQIRAEAVLELN